MRRKDLQRIAGEIQKKTMIDNSKFKETCYLKLESVTQSGRHSGRRWKKMEEDGRRWTKKKSSKKIKKNVDCFCLESAGDGLGTLVGVQIAPKKYFGH